MWREDIMATVTKQSRKSRAKAKELPPLMNGDRLDQKTFHERYEAMPDNVRAELIGGIVYMSSPQLFPHGESQSFVSHWLVEYRRATPGTKTHLNSTQIMGPESEVQPDAALFVAPQYGGQVRIDTDLYAIGAPDLVAEISWSTESIDLHAKKDDYEAAGVREYVVVALRRKQVFWFTRHRGKFKEMSPDKDGIFRSQVFPGLWLDPAPLLRDDYEQVFVVLHQGLKTPEHPAFVAKLASQLRKS
jgi:Uma2 family endonuclease